MAELTRELSDKVGGHVYAPPRLSGQASLASPSTIGLPSLKLTALICYWKNNMYTCPLVKSMEVLNDQDAHMSNLLCFPLTKTIVGFAMTNCS